MHHFVELTVITDSDVSNIAGPFKGSFRPELIASFVDIYEHNEEKRRPAAKLMKTMITLTEPGDFVNSEDDTGGVVRTQRMIYVQESYDEVKKLLANGGRNDPAL